MTVVNHPIERSDLLRAAAAALRVHDRAGDLRRAPAARPADGRQPGPLRDPGRRRGRRRQLPRATAAATRPPRPQIVGWSQDCAAPTRIDYLYKTTDGSFQLARRPDGPARRRRDDDDPRRPTVPYVVRWERGTINRFIYSVAMLAPVGEADPASPTTRCGTAGWSSASQGGVAIGRTPGHDERRRHAVRAGARPGLRRRQLDRACARTRTTTSSSAARPRSCSRSTSSRTTASRSTPSASAARAGRSSSTSTGRTIPGLLDAAIPQYSYPDMVTQTIHVGDCELLEHYFDVTDRDNPRWRDPEVRQAVMGLNASAAPAEPERGRDRAVEPALRALRRSRLPGDGPRPGVAGAGAHRVPARRGSG